MLEEAGFVFKKQLGKGASGVTGLFKDPKGGPDIAIKLLKRPLPKPSIPSVLQEITIQASLGEGHVNIIEAKEAILTDTHLCLVMEYAAGQVLTDYVGSKWDLARKTGLYLSEDEARYLFRQFITAVAYCHHHCVAHRDLKLDNTLLDGKSPGRVKLCDFGFSKEWSGEGNMKTLIGTPDYMAPQLRNKEAGGQGYLGTAADVWASGVLLIVMLLGTFPFEDDEKDGGAQDKPWSQAPDIKKSVHKLSPEVRDLLDKILVPNEADRITIPNIKAHPWYVKPLPGKFAEAEKALLADQHAVERRVSAVRICSTSKAGRDQQLEHIVQAAGRRAPAGGAPIIRIDLHGTAVAQHPSMKQGLQNLAEE